jgi:4-amino-4-deoxy-L-arabinose transferase-like glycosyltransferase
MRVAVDRPVQGRPDDPGDRGISPAATGYPISVPFLAEPGTGRAGALARFCSRHYIALAASVLLLAAVNLGFRLDRELVTEWDEAMYSLSASEMVASGNWVGTTIHGELDYYNAKPPLNVWLIAGSFKLFGQSLLSLRLPSAVAAWLAVLVLMTLARRTCGPAVALLAGVVLSTNFGFIFVHAGRSADPDALLALLMLLTVTTLWAAHDKPSRLIWLGPVIAGVFLLKGMAAVLPLAMVLAAELGRRPLKPSRWTFLGAASLLFLLPVGLWAALRWQLDGGQFLRRVVYNDFIGHTMDVLDGHAHSPLFYLNLLQKHEYGWLIALTAALILAPIPREQWRRGLRYLSDRSAQGFVLLVWAALTMVVPTMMRTKLPWYLNSFYPVFALGTAWILVRALSIARAPRRRWILGATIAIVFIAAEARLAWYSVQYRDLTKSVQGLLLAERSQLDGQLVFATHWDNAETFVLRALVRGRTAVVSNLEEFLVCGSDGDYLLWSSALADPALTLVRTDGRGWLYRRHALRAGRR